MSIRHEFSYWLTSMGEPSDLANFHQALEGRGIVPDYLVLEPDSCSVGKRLYKVDPNVGTIEEWRGANETIGEIAKSFPDVKVLFHIIDEEDHAVESMHCWYKDQYAVRCAQVTSPDENELLREVEGFNPIHLSRADIIWRAGGYSVVDKVAGVVLKGYADTYPTAEEALKAYCANIAAAERPQAKEGNKLAGGYVLVTTYASLSDEEAKLVKDEDEVPTCVLAIKEEFLLESIKEEYESLEVFFNEYTYDTIEGLEAKAELGGALAFTYREDADEPFSFPDCVPSDAILAYTDFLSGKLLEEGHDDASKFLDCMLAL